MNGKFKPAWWLPGPHLQTIWPILSGRRSKLDLLWEQMELSDGDFLDLAWVSNNQKSANQPIILLLHGLTGSVQSPQMLGLLETFTKMGWRAVLMHFRGCSGKPNRLLRSYHAGDTDDIDFVIKQFHSREPCVRIAVVGVSLGANVLLKWLGETARDDLICAAVAISVPFELDKAVTRLNFGFSRVYQWWILKQLQKEVLAKFDAMGIAPTAKQVANLRTFWEFDDKISAPLHGFHGAYDYYKRCSSRTYIKNIQVPTLLIHAINDPFVSVNSIPHMDELSPMVQLELTKSGGHVGFISGKLPGRAQYWLENRLPRFLTTYI